MRSVVGLFLLAPNRLVARVQLELGDFDERLRRDLDERRLRREQLAARMEAAEARERAFHRRPASTKSKHMGPSASFQERLRQDLEKRRAREQR